MTVSCPFAVQNGVMFDCVSSCRFHTSEPSVSSTDKDDPGSCRIEQFLRVFSLETPDIRRELTDIRKAVENIEV